VASNAPQRSYRAPCPGCGAPVEFRSAQSAFAVCSYCQSTVVRDGQTLSRIGKMAELFDDHSPLQLMAAGRWQGQPFTLLGRLQYRSGSGPWTEWHAVFDDGSSAFLAEDNGAYVLARPAEVLRPLPQAAQLRVGATTAIDGKRFDVASNEQALLVSAQGELPKLPPLNQGFAMVELRSADGEVLAIDYGSTPPSVTRGRSVLLEELALTGLRADSAVAVQGRQFNCPNCGAAVQVLLAASKSIVCPSCHSVIDLGVGTGAELRHAQQDEPVRPLIPLGSLGQLQGAQWQVVGYQNRTGWAPGEEDERFGWDEYLLFNHQRGFIFVVDSAEGWSVVKPTTGAPTLSPNGNSASYLGTNYRLQYSYHAETNYVAGEFYWPVERGQRTFNRDFAAGGSLLSMEETPRERTWSSGSKIASDTVANAFGLAGKESLARGDAGPTSGRGAGWGIGCFTLVAIMIALLVLLALLRACDGNGGSTGYRGGSYGGYSSGGSHK
jgi:DNA-directed RNA polymerase subunit RPC12/RpoP